MTITKPPQLLEQIARDVAGYADTVVPLGAGLCLPVTAGVCHALNQHGVSDVHGVCGSFDVDAHWWVRVGEWIVDPTRGQFDNGPVVCHVGSDDARLYYEEHAYPPGWTEEHVVMEAKRAFQFEEAGTLFGCGLLEVLRLTIAEVTA